MELLEPKRRNNITWETSPMLDAINAVLEQLHDYLPVSLRTIHYNLLNAPPPINAKHPKVLYANEQWCNRHLVDVAMRGRVLRLIDEDAISDETRPIATWNTYADADEFRAAQNEQHLVGYARDLMRSQPDHLELLVEKNTVANLLDAVAGQYCIPMTSGRGFASYPPRRDMRNRFKASGKARLVLVVVSDFDAAGETIAESYARSMRDDFGIDNIVPVKAALTHEQVKTMRLEKSVEKKEASTHAKYFERMYGRRQACYELEALPPATLQAVVRASIEAKLDMKLLQKELRREAAERKALARERRRLV